jgi:hypothetical protein
MLFGHHAACPQNPKRRGASLPAALQDAGALAMEASQPKAPEDWRSPRRYRAIPRFMVPMHAKKRKGAFHEPSIRITPASDLAEDFLLLSLTFILILIEAWGVRVRQTRGSWSQCIYQGSQTLRRSKEFTGEPVTLVNATVRLSLEALGIFVTVVHKTKFEDNES